MSDKQDMIKRMLELQAKFCELDADKGVDPFDYYTPASGSFLAEYRKEYQELASKVIDLAHAEAGSHR